MNTAEVRLRRACLVVPANDRRKLEKAAGLEVDQVILDLEDAVSPAHKTDDTRRAAAEAVIGLPWRAPTVSIRVNAADSDWFARDIAVVAPIAAARLATIVIPKVEAAATVAAAVAALDAAGATGTAGSDAPAATAIGIECQIESPVGLLAVEAIAAASPRLEALIFGPGDYAAAMDMPMMAIGAFDPSYPGDQWAYPRARITVAARAFGLDAIDGPYAAFRDAEGHRESARRARLLGMGGKWVIHPDQVGVCMDVFSASPEEVEAARRTIATLDEAAGAGRGAAAEAGTMVDEASRRQALRILARARATGG